MPIQRLVITVSQIKRRLLHVPTQKASYCSQPEKKKAASRAYSKASYCSQPEKKN